MRKTKKLMIIMSDLSWKKQPSLIKKTINQFSQTWIVVYCTRLGISWLRILFDKNTRRKLLISHAKKNNNFYPLYIYEPIPLGRIQFLSRLNKTLSLGFITLYVKSMLFIKNRENFFWPPSLVWFFNTKNYRFINKFSKTSILIDTLDYQVLKPNSYEKFVLRYKASGLIYHPANPKVYKASLAVVKWDSGLQKRLKDTQATILKYVN